MARIRTIKPEFPQSESMGRVSRDARLTFVLLWTLADDSGRLRGNSRMLASLLFPYDSDAAKKIDEWLKELEAERCIIRYEVDGNTYVQVLNWLSHQKIDKPTKSKLPEFANPRELSANPRDASRLTREASFYPQNGLFDKSLTGGVLRDECDDTACLENDDNVRESQQFANPREGSRLSREDSSGDQGPKDLDKGAHSGGCVSQSSGKPPSGKSSPALTGKKFQKPTVEEIEAYCDERDNAVPPEDFWNFYESNGWKVGRNPMKDWRAAVRTWEKSHVKPESRVPTAEDLANWNPVDAGLGR